MALGIIGDRPVASRLVAQCSRTKGASLAIVNVPRSTIARESDAVLPTPVGPEISVASGKAFTCQLAALGCLAIMAGRQRGVLSERDETGLNSSAD